MKIKNSIGIVLAICLVGAIHTAKAQTTNLTQQILKMHTFREGLVWTGDKEPSEAENKELLEVLNHLNEEWWSAGLEQFLKDHPNSPWAISLHYDYASFCRRTGRTTKALEQFEAGWTLAKNDTSPQGQRLGGTILANWTDLLASLGRLEKLKELVAIGDQWHFANPQDRDKYQGAKSSYLLMREHPEMAYRCGTFALKAIGGVLQPNNQSLESLVQIPSPTNGFSMAGLLDLAKKYGLNLVAVRRTVGQDLIVPSVVHWRQNHYAAILDRQDGNYLVNDPTFGKPKWMPAEVINEEASGEFLVPAALQTNGWTRLALNEARAIHGMGLPNNINDGKDKTSNKPCPGMPTWWVSEPYINVWMTDEPLSYRTSRGEPFTFRISYKQRDTAAADSPEINPGLENSWFSFIQVDDSEACYGGGSCPIDLFVCDATLYLPNGGAVDYPQAGDNLGEARFDAETRTTLQQQFPVVYPSGDPFANPIALKSGFDYGNNGIQIAHADGSRDIYGYGFIYNNVSGDYPQAQYYLTRRIDAHGDTTWFNYNETTNFILVLQSVVDYDGLTNTLQYTSGGLLSEVTNPYGQSAQFKYDASGNLTNIVDAAGMSSSMTYDTNGYPTTLITPYGTTTFSIVQNVLSGEGNFGGDSGDNPIQRAVLVTDPVGANYLYMYRYDSSPFMSTSYPSGNVPTGTPLGTLDDGTSGTNFLTGVCYRNSFYWGPRQYPTLSTTNIFSFTANDYLRGRMQHWLEDTNQLDLTGYLSVEQDASPDGSTAGLQTFYDYQGKLSGYNFCAGTYPLPSVQAWRLPNGETHYQYEQFDYFGNITNLISTYTLPNGSAGTRTNQFVYANNSYTHYFSVLPNGGDIFLTNVFTIPDLLIQVIGADGNTIWSYGGFDSMVWSNNFQSDPSSGTNSTILYSSRVLPDYATNGLGQVSSFTYGNPIPASDYFAIYGGNYQLGTTFSGYNKVTSATSVAGLTTTNIYNANGFLTRMIDLQIGRTNSFGYTNDGLVGSLTNGLGLNLTVTWDNLLRLTSVQYPDGTYASNLFNKLDLGGVRDRLGHWTYYGYDAARHLTSITNANNAVTVLDWCECGALTGIVDPLNNTTTLNYNNQGDLTNATFPDYSSLNYQYDLAGRITNVLDGAGRSLQVSYNNQGLMTTLASAYGVWRQVAFDILDRPISIKDANGVIVTNQYNTINELVKRTWPDGISESYGYNAAGLMACTNRDNQVTHYGLDAAGRISSVTNANGEIVQAGYNPADEITSLVDGLGHTNSWQYNQYGWLTNKVDGLGRDALQLAYNANGWITNRLTPQKGNTGYGFDNVGNLTSIAYPSSTISYAYNALNQLTNMVDASGTTIFSYTPAGQLASENGPWVNDTITNSYVQQLRMALSLSQPSGSWSQTYGYDSAWRMTNVVSPAGAFGYSYNFQAASALASSIALPNGAGITNSYDSLARLTQTTLNNHWGHILDGYAYAPDALGLRTNIVRNLGLTSSSVNVGFDNIAQIISWAAKETNGTSRLNEQLGFGFDAADNLHSRTSGALSQTFSVDAANELTSVSRSGTFTLGGETPAPATNITVNGQTAQTYGDFTFAATNNTLVNGTNTFAIVAQNTYGVAVTNNLTLNLPTSVSLSFDNNGNLTNDGTRALAYDSENQLTNVMVAGQWQSSFVYDGLNRRRIARDYSWSGSAWVETNEVRYIYDGYLLVQERDTNNNPLVTYTRGIDLSGSFRAGGIGGLLARTDTNGSTFYHADGVGNVTALMDGNENIVARYLYGPFGKLVGERGSMASVNEMQFSSMPQHDGIILYPFRGYDPNLQRFLNQDPIRELGGINLYRFSDNNPFNYIDPLGLIDCAALNAAIGNMENLIDNGIKSMSDINQQFDNALWSSDASLAESAAGVLYSIAGLGASLTENAAKNATYAIQVSKGTIPVGVIGANTTGGSVVLSGSGIAGPVSAANVGAGVIGAQEAGQDIGQEIASDASQDVQRVLDPYGRLADVQNENGAEMSASTYDTIKNLQGTLGNLMDQYNKNCCKK